ncbi:MAG: hypothetical protein C0609_09355 [Deltaproteobacteria bacterium]|nr:MAG: hypothetical protein C0609_09355 [Deltaproteobacteria bacterium]
MRTGKHLSKKLSPEAIKRLRARRRSSFIRKSATYFYYRSVRIHAKPREVAMGMAIGLAVGMTPTIPFQMVIAVFIASLLGQSKITAALGCWITNPITAIPVYAGTYALGAVLMGRPLYPHINEWFASHGTSMELFKSLLTDFALPFWVGGFVSAVPIAIGGYWITYQMVIAYRLKVRAKRKDRLHEWKWDPKHGWYRVLLDNEKDREKE